MYVYVIIMLRVNNNVMPGRSILSLNPYQKRKAKPTKQSLCQKTEIAISEDFASL